MLAARQRGPRQPRSQSTRCPRNENRSVVRHPCSSPALCAETAYELARSAWLRNTRVNLWFPIGRDFFHNKLRVFYRESKPQVLARDNESAEFFSPNRLELCAATCR